MDLNITRLTSASFWIFVFILLHLTASQTTVHSSADKTEVRKASTETNAFNFIRLFVMRMIYGFANMIGLGGFLEDFAGGIFVPPSVDYDFFEYGNENDDYKEYNDYNY